MTDSQLQLVAIAQTIMRARGADTMSGEREVLAVIDRAVLDTAALVLLTPTDVPAVLGELHRRYCVVR